jgi:hypothetical protein
MIVSDSGMMNLRAACGFLLFAASVCLATRRPDRGSMCLMDAHFDQHDVTGQQVDLQKFGTCPDWRTKFSAIENAGLPFSETANLFIRVRIYVAVVRS